MYTLLSKNELNFPDITTSDENGILALGGDLSVKRLILAYKNGIFPWYNKEEPIIWWSPNPRMVLFPSELKVSKSMKKLFREETFKITFNQAFETVIENCAKIKRSNQNDTWIHDEMLNAYLELHKIGIAKSVEVWQNNKIVGGLYGIQVNHVFTGESMFSKVSNASKYGFIYMVKNSNYRLIDCQVYTKHLDSLGARLIARKEFMEHLKFESESFNKT